MYSTWNIVALKAKLRERGASTRGRKADLVERLEAYDRNMNFDAIENDQNDDLKMVIPEPNAFRDINSSMELPSLTKEHTLFFLQFQKSPNEGQALYESRFLHVLRVASIDGFVYIKGIVKASMKRIVYEVNLKLRFNGEIEESSCECVAGQGVSAHCKHVAVVLCGTEDFINNKILLKTVTPTETLQTFHKPKKIFTGSPIRSHKLPTKRKSMDNVVFYPYKKQIKVQEYNQQVRSIVLNCNSKMPLKQLYEPANPYGIDHDHLYLGSHTNKVLADLELANISASRITEIEAETCGQQNNPNWWSFRHCRLTASIFHTICRMRDPTKLSLARQILNKNKILTRATTHGIINEKVALKQYIELYELDIIESGLHISEERPYLAASPDGLLNEESIIEIKCPYASRNQIISHITVPYLILVEDKLQLKMETPYYYQIQGQLYCTKRKYCNLIVYTYKSMEVIFVDRNEEFIQHMLCKLESFYNNYFKDAILNHYYYKDYLDLIKK